MSKPETLKNKFKVYMALHGLKPEDYLNGVSGLPELCGICKHRYEYCSERKKWWMEIKTHKVKYGYRNDKSIDLARCIEWVKHV